MDGRPHNAWRNALIAKQYRDKTGARRSAPMPFEIPSPSQTFEVPLSDGARILMRRHGNPDGVRLLVTHGNGFAADAYYPYWRHLLPDFDVLVFDFRNHGWNAPVTPSNHHYAQLADDLEAV